MSFIGLHTSEDVFAGDFESLLLSIGASEKITGLEASKPMMNGTFCYHAFQNGLSMHSVNAIEQQTTGSTIELPPGLSFNFMYSGRIEFDFAQQKYVMEAINEQDHCFAIISSTPELMKRQTKQGEKVQKLNIFVELSWLEARCQSQSDIQKLRHLFAQQRVCCWAPNAKAAEAAKQLLVLKKASNLSQLMQAEQLTIQVLVACFDDLYDHVCSLNDSQPIDTNNQASNLKTLINAQLEHYSSVADIASAMGMSERTLQRKFQQSYASSVSSYVKHRKMEQAKVALLIHGKTVGEAAYIAGYKHPSNFISAFKKETNLTPSEFVRSND